MKVLLKRAAALLFSVVIILSIMPGSVSAQEMATVFELPKMSTGIMSSEVLYLFGKSELSTMIWAMAFFKLLPTAIRFTKRIAVEIG